MESKINKGISNLDIPTGESHIQLVSREALLKSFDGAKEDVAQLCKDMNDMMITDNNSNELAVEIGGKANKLLKAIDEKRSLIKTPYYNTGKAIDDLAKEFTKPLQAAIDSLKKKVIDFKIAEENRKQKDISRLQAKRAGVIQGGEDELKRLQWAIRFFTDSYNGLMDILETDKDLNSVSNRVKILLTFPSATEFGIYVPQAKTLHTMYKDLALSYMNSLKSKSPDTKRIYVQNSLTLKNLLNEQILKPLYDNERVIALANQGANVEIVSEMIQVSESKTAGQTRDHWTFEVKGFSDIPLQFLMVDEKAINQWIKDNKESVVNGTASIPGIKFVNKPIAVF